MAVSNLIKNRRLYYPFALATCVAVAISYIFNSLAFNPNLSKMTGASSIIAVLILGLVIVNITAGIIVFYANSFVMKNRSKELGLYGMLGLNKRHLFVMTFIELLIFGLVAVSLGLTIGVLFDQLIYAFLLKLMGTKVVLVSTFQLPVLILVFIFYGFIFAGLVFVNGWRILRFDSLKMSKEKASGEKKSRFLLPQTFIGLAALLYGYYLAQTVRNPMEAIFIFFGAVLLVILGTYLLFNAGITVFLQLLQKNKKYYYQPNNMISVSNLIYRMKKNAVGLATISILSTMVLVTFSAGMNIYSGAEFMQKLMFPHDFSINGGVNAKKEQLDQVLTEFVAENQLKVKQQETYQFYSMGVEHQKGNQLDIYPKGQRAVTPSTYILMFSSEDYQKLTGRELDLQENEVAAFNKGADIDFQQPLQLAGQTLTVKEVLTEDFVYNKIPDEFNIIVPKGLYLVAKDPSQLLAPQMEQLAIYTSLYGGLDIEASENEKAELNTAYQKKMADYNQSLPEGAGGVHGETGVVGMREINGMLGGVFFIGIFLSIVFMMGTVLVIYYKQISEGYEDRERFVILQKVGLDEQQIRKTIRKQVQTVFFLPLIFAFVHLAFAYHMLSLILQMLGVLNAGLMLAVTLGVCAIFFISYIIVFAITSRSYRKIISM
nr:ABC transporter permease [Streptococcus panodentis]